MAVSAVSNQIRNGEIEVGLAVGFESMSATCVLVVFSPRLNKERQLTCFPLGKNSPDRGADSFAEEVLAHPVARDTQHPMGWTSENVSKG